MSAHSLRGSPFDRRLWLVLCTLAVLPGCAGYMIGNRTLYPCGVRTVHVPVFESNSFRRGLGERLTEAVVKEIELKTPYKVVNSQQADSVLTGRVLREVKGVLVEAPSDDPRDLQYNMKVEVTWLDRKGTALRQSQAIPLPGAVALIDQTADFVPEVGQSVTTAEQQAIERLATQIVSLMETPW